jgi:hypothetical protein
LFYKFIEKRSIFTYAPAPDRTKFSSVVQQLPIFPLTNSISRVQYSLNINSLNFSSLYIK